MKSQRKQRQIEIAEGGLSQYKKRAIPQNLIPHNFSLHKEALKTSLHSLPPFSILRSMSLISRYTH